MNFKDGKFRGELPSADSSLVIFVSFYNESNNILENNDGGGYLILLYDNKRDKPLKGAHIIVAKQHMSNSSGLDLSRSLEKAVVQMDQELTAHPDMTTDFDLIRTYRFAIGRLKSQFGMDQLRNMAELLTQDKKDGEKLTRAGNKTTPDQIKED